MKELEDGEECSEMQTSIDDVTVTLTSSQQFGLPGQNLFNIKAVKNSSMDCEGTPWAPTLAEELLAVAT